MHCLSQARFAIKLKDPDSRSWRGLLVELAHLFPNRDIIGKQGEDLFGRVVPDLNS